MQRYVDSDPPRYDNGFNHALISRVKYLRAPLRRKTLEGVRDFLSWVPDPTKPPQLAVRLVVPLRWVNCVTVGPHRGRRAVDGGGQGVRREAGRVHEEATPAPKTRAAADAAAIFFRTDWQ